ncbi:hypothetical protein MN0502_07060 [Arthrobacter sp. MN05-02]|nr:hypothetical protein MN0502_07060 [Arthrobacter sp. MN05-02]
MTNTTGTKTVQQPLLAIDNLNVSFSTPRGVVDVVRDVSLALAPGKALALVGESGSGKTVTARTLVGLNAANARVSADRLDVLGRDAARLSERQWRRLRGKDIGYVLQDALVSLDPLRTVGQEIDEALRAHGIRGRDERQERVYAALRDAGIPDPEVRARQRSGELSGGLRQRALIAQATVLDPQLVIADEPTTALDATVQAQILELLAGLKEQGRGLIFISHDLAVVSHLADEIAVMQHGRIVESGRGRRGAGQPAPRVHAPADRCRALRGGQGHPALGRPAGLRDLTAHTGLGLLRGRTGTGGPQPREDLRLPGRLASHRGGRRLLHSPARQDAGHRR